MKTNTIIQGDCLEVMREMEDESVDFCLTDPPYGVDWQSNRRAEKYDKINNDDNLDWLHSAFSQIYRVLKNDSLCVSFYGYPDADIFVKCFKDVGFRIVSHFCFVKNSIGLGWFTRGQHEVAYLLAKGKPLKPQNAISDVVKFKKTGNKLHPSQKPIGAMERIVETYTQVGDIILDPFMGVGSTLVAAKNLNRKYIGIEIESRYVEIAHQRLAQETLRLE